MLSRDVDLTDTRDFGLYIPGIEFDENPFKEFSDVTSYETQIGRMELVLEPDGTERFRTVGRIFPWSCYTIHSEDELASTFTSDDPASNEAGLEIYGEFTKPFLLGNKLQRMYGLSVIEELFTTARCYSCGAELNALDEFYAPQGICRHCTRPHDLKQDIERLFYG